MPPQKNRKFIMVVIGVVVMATLGLSAWMIYNATTRLQ
jgi:hypothetical protein